MSQEKEEVRIGRSLVKYGGVDLGFTEGEITLTYSLEYRDFVPDQQTAKCKKFLLNEAAMISVPLAQSLARSFARGKMFPNGELKATALGGGGSSTSANAEVAGATTIDVQAGQGTNFTAGNYVLIGAGKTAVLHKIDTIATDELTLTEPLQFDQAAGVAILEVDRTKTRIAVGNAAGEPPTAELTIEPTDGSDAIKFYSAVISDEWELTLQKAEESVTEIQFEAIADSSRALGDQLMTIGDLTVS